MHMEKCLTLRYTTGVGPIGKDTTARGARTGAAPNVGARTPAGSRAKSAQHMAYGCRGACEAELTRVGPKATMKGFVVVDLGLLLTVYLVTVS